MLCDDVVCRQRQLDTIPHSSHLPPSSTFNFNQDLPRADKQRFSQMKMNCCETEALCQNFDPISNSNPLKRNQYIQTFATHPHLFLEPKTRQQSALCPLTLLLHQFLAS